jgi:hypothetical protein
VRHHGDDAAAGAEARELRASSSETAATFERERQEDGSENAALRVLRATCIESRAYVADATKEHECVGGAACWRKESLQS